MILLRIFIKAARQHRSGPRLSRVFDFIECTESDCLKIVSFFVKNIPPVFGIATSIF